MELNGWCPVLLGRSHIQQRLALGLVYAGQTGDVHPFVATVGAQGAQTDAAVGLPDLYRPFTAAAGEDLAVGRQCHAPKHARVAAQGAQSASGASVPETGRTIRIAACQVLAI